MVARRSQNPVVVLRILSLVFGLIALAFLAVGIVLLLLNSTFSSKTAQTVGTVVNMVGEGNNNSSALAPVVTYQVSGQTFTYQSPIYSSISSYKVGDSVTIYYDPAKPNDADIDSFGVGKLLAIIFLIIGGVWAIVTLILLVIRFSILRRRF